MRIHGSCAYGTHKQSYIQSMIRIRGWLHTHEN